MDFKKFYEQVYFDIDSNINKIFRATQGDTKSRGYYVTILQNNVIIPATNQTLIFYAEKPDKTRVLINAIKEGDKFRVDLTNQVFAVSGLIDCQLVLKGSAGETLADTTFQIKVSKSLVDDAIFSEDERSFLDEAFQLAYSLIPKLERLDIQKIEDLLVILEDTDMPELDDLISRLKAFNLIKLENLVPRIELIDIERLEKLDKLDADSLTMSSERLDNIDLNLMENLQGEFDILNNKLFKGIVSETEPVAPYDGMIWFKIGLPEEVIQNPISGYFMCLDAYDFRLQADGSEITEWVDKGINNYALKPKLDSPTFYRKGLNDKPTIRFDNSPLSVKGFTLQDSQNFTISIVFRPNMASDSHLFAMGMENDASNRIISVNYVGTQRIARARLNTISLWVSPDLAIKENVTKIITMTYDKSKLEVYIDGVLDKSIDYGRTLTATDIFTLGGINGTEEAFYGDISEYIHYPTKLNPDDIESLHAYLKTKWGI